MSGYSYHHKTYFNELENRLRGQVVRIKIGSIDDKGERQRVSGFTHQGVERSNVEVYQTHGFSSKAPKGSIGLAVAVGADQGDLVVISVNAPGARAVNLEDGESIHYGQMGQRVHMKADGSVDVQSAVGITATTPTFTITGNLVVKGDISAVGNLSTEGDVAFKGDKLTHNGHDVGSTHLHTGVVAGAALTGTPQ